MTNSEQTKACTTCQEEKVISEFHKEKNGKYGVKSKCKDCFYWDEVIISTEIEWIYN